MQILKGIWNRKRRKTYIKSFFPGLAAANLSIVGHKGGKRKGFPIREIFFHAFNEIHDVRIPHLEKNLTIRSWFNVNRKTCQSFLKI